MIDPLPLERAFVTKSYVVDGQPFVDCRRPGVGAKDWTGVPVMVLGGGPGRFLALPAAPAGKSLLDGAEVVIGFFANRKAVVLGTIGAVKGMSDANEAQQGPNANMTPKIDSNAAGIAWDGATFAMRGGGALLEAADGKDVSVQVSGDGVFRVAGDGDASDWAVLAKALVSELAPLYAKVNALDAQVAALTLAVQALALASGIVPPPVPPSHAASALEPMATTDVAAKVLRVSGEVGG